MAVQHRSDYEAQGAATVTILGERQRELSAQVDGLAGLTLRLVVDSALALGTAVKVEWGETLLLGEVVGCQPAAGRHRALLHLEHSLLHTAGLARLAERVLRDAAGAPAERRGSSGGRATQLNRPATP